MNGHHPGLEPIAVTIPDAVRISGESRTAIYKNLADGRLKGVKSGRRTLILMESLRAHLGSLPEAQFGPRGTPAE